MKVHVVLPWWWRLAVWSLLARRALGLPFDPDKVVNSIARRIRVRAA